MAEKKKILIVDDEVALRRALCDSLNLMGEFSIFDAGDGEAALEINRKEHPDLILLDLIMPAMDGMSAFKKIREDGWGKKVPIIILTNLSAAKDQPIDDENKNALTYYLIKSDWKLHDIVKKIEGILKGQNVL